jgi:hypothetical protein
MNRVVEQSFNIRIRNGIGTILCTTCMITVEKMKKKLKVCDFNNNIYPSHITCDLHLHIPSKS